MLLGKGKVALLNQHRRQHRAPMGVSHREAMSLRLHVVVFVALVMSLAGLSESAVPIAEREALVALYDATNGAGWANSTNWLGAPGTECEWYGVTCDASEATVTKLVFYSNSLIGEIPSALGSLTGLTELSLPYNGLSGSIPPELGTLTALVWLSLPANDLSGEIPPELGRLKSLEYLGLHYNELTGEIPGELGDLTSLEKLELHTNQLVGMIPPQMGNLASLEYLFLDHNQLSGAIPRELGNLTNLRQLSLWDNHLTGAIPASLGTLVNLELLYLLKNRLGGEIPAEIGNMAALEYAWFHANRLTGEIPSDLVDLSNLRYITLGHNALRTDDPNLLAFLSSVPGDDWEDTQTTPPTNIVATLTTTSAVELEWTPVNYSVNHGFYAVFLDPAPVRDEIFVDGFEAGDTYWWEVGNPWATTDKTAGSILVDGLDPNTTYAFTVRTVTEPNGWNSNQVVSEPSDTVIATTQAR